MKELKMGRIMLETSSAYMHAFLITILGSFIFEYLVAVLTRHLKEPGSVHVQPSLNA